MVFGWQDAEEAVFLRSIFILHVVPYRGRSCAVFTVRFHAKLTGTRRSDDRLHSTQAV